MHTYNAGYDLSSPAPAGHKTLHTPAVQFSRSFGRRNALPLPQTTARHLLSQHQTAALKLSPLAQTFLAPRLVCSVPDRPPAMYTSYTISHTVLPSIIAIIIIIIL